MCTTDDRISISTPGSGVALYAIPPPVSVMPYVVMQLLGGVSIARDPPTKIDLYKLASTRCSAVGTRDVSVAPWRAASS